MISSNHGGVAEKTVSPGEKVEVSREIAETDEIPEEVLVNEGGSSSSRDKVEKSRQGEKEYYDDDGAVVFEEGGEEAKSVRVPTEPTMVSREMRRKHQASGHCPYRSWCETCVRGACNLPAHHSRPEEKIGDVPEIHMDYCFFRDKRNEKEKTRTALVAVDRDSSTIIAHAVPKKGAGGGFIVKQLCRDIKRCGHRKKVLIRSDGEPSIKDLADKVANMRAGETLLECSPAGDSRANGRAERAVQTVEKQVRILKLALDEAVGATSVAHPIFTWLILHAADVLTKFKVRPDGLTAYEYFNGRAYSGLMVDFGTLVLRKSSAKVQGGDMQPR